MASSTPTPDRPPGWYADPTDSDRMSYWDGRRWTGSQRPRPSWQPRGAAAAAEEREARRRWAHGWRSWAVIGGAVVVVAGLAWITLPKPDHPGPRVVTDTAFAGAASTRCRAVIPGLRPPLPDPNAKPPTANEVATNIEHVADGLAGLAAQLRTLPVGPADQATVDGWLRGWDEYTDVGRRYAAALRSGDQAAQRSLSKQGDTVQKSTDRFARANGLSACQFFIVPQSSGSDPFSGGG